MKQAALTHVIVQCHGNEQIKITSTYALGLDPIYVNEVNKKTPDEQEQV